MTECESGSLVSAVDGPELRQRMTDRATPPLDRAAHWWGEVAALASRSRGPGPWSWNVALHGHLDRYCHRGANTIRRDYLGRAIQQLATAIHEAGLAQHVRELGPNVGGRRVVVPLLRRAVRIAEVGQAGEMQADQKINTAIAALLSDVDAQLTVNRGDLRDEVLSGQAFAEGGVEGHQTVSDGRDYLAAQPQAIEQRDRVAKEHAAIAALVGGKTSIAAISRQIGVARTTLYSYSTFKDAHGKAVAEKEQRKNARRGRRAGENDFAREHDID